MYTDDSLKSDSAEASIKAREKPEVDKPSAHSGGFTRSYNISKTLSMSLEKEKKRPKQFLLHVSSLDKGTNSAVSGSEEE
jgi:hypothetical protein